MNAMEIVKSDVAWNEWDFGELNECNFAFEKVSLQPSSYHL